MADQSQKETIRQAILEVLRVRGNEVSLPDLLDDLRARGLTSDGNIKMVIWPLMSESVLELTDQRKLRLVPHP